MRADEKERLLDEAPKQVLEEMVQQLLLLSRADQLRFNVTQQELDSAMSETRRRMGVEDEETFQRGQQVRIIRGPFEGMDAIFDQHLSGRDRVRVFFDLVNRMQVSVEMDKGDLLPPS